MPKDDDRCGPIDFCIGFASMALKTPESEIRSLFGKVAGGALIAALGVGGSIAISNTYIIPQPEKKPAVIEYKVPVNYLSQEKCIPKDYKPFCVEEKIK